MRLVRLFYFVHHSINAALKSVCVSVFLLRGGGQASMNPVWVWVPVHSVPWRNCDETGWDSVPVPLFISITAKPPWYPGGPHDELPPAATLTNHLPLRRVVLTRSSSLSYYSGDLVPPEDTVQPLFKGAHPSQNIQQ